MTHWRTDFDQISVDECSDDPSSLATPLMPSQRQFTIHPSEAGGGGHEHLSVVSAEKVAALPSMAPNISSAPFELAEGTAELLELAVGPVQQEDLLVELITAGAITSSSL